MGGEGERRVLSLRVTGRVDEAGLGGGGVRVIKRDIG